MRRAVAHGLVAAALLTALYVIYAGFTCGASVVREPCGSAEECAAASSCVSAVHPFAVPYALVALASFAAVWRDLPGPLLVAGVAGAAFGTLAGFSLGPAGLLVSLFLVAAGIALRPRSVVAWGALVAALAPIAAMVLVVANGPRSILAAWLVVFVPLVAWLALSAWHIEKRA